MRGRTLAISAYLFLAALAVPAMVGAQTTTPSPAGQPEPYTPDPAQVTGQPAQGDAPNADPGTLDQSGAYDRRNDRHGGKGNPDASAKASSPVRIVDFLFKPKTINIEVGDTITWTNEDSDPHTATANNGSFDTHTLKKGQSGSHTFTENATIKYTCIIHPDMKGTVVVGNGGSGGGSSGSGGGSGGTSSSSSNPFAGGTSSGGSGASSSLPSTGQNELPLIVGGAVFLTLGLLLRRWVWARI